MNRHIKSALITFGVAFAIVVVPQLDTLSIDSLTDGALLGILFAGIRGGVKAGLELFIAYNTNDK